MKKRAITIIETSLVVIISGLILTSIVGFIAKYTSQHAIINEDERMHKVNSAIIRYFTIHKSLPCPLAPNAISTAVTTCSGTTPVEGAVPYKALGLNIEDIYDEYGRQLTYLINPLYSTPNTSSTTHNTHTTNILIYYNNLPSHSPSGPLMGLVTGDNLITIPYLIINHGVQGRGAHTNTPTAALYKPCSNNSQELDNCSSTHQYVYRYKKNLTAGADYYDDTLMWLPASVAGNHYGMHSKKIRIRNLLQVR